MNATITQIFDAILEGDQKAALRSIEQALAEGLEPSQILNEGMISAMAEVGLRFETGELYVPEMLISARARKSGLAILRPYLVSEGVQAAGKVLIGTVKGDLHDIGKNLVATMLEGAGFEVIDLGTDVSPERFVVAAQTENPQIIALSALLTTTMTSMKDTNEALRAAGLRENTKVIVGGAPVTEAYAREIGADGFASDASRAVSVAKSLL